MSNIKPPSHVSSKTATFANHDRRHRGRNVTENILQETRIRGDIVRRLRAPMWSVHPVDIQQCVTEAAQEIVALRAALKAYARGVRQIANNMPPPNAYTPQLIQGAVEVEVWLADREAGRRRT